MSIVHKPAVPGHRLAVKFERKLRGQSLVVPQWQFPTPTADPRRRRRVRLRRRLRAAARVAAVVIESVALGVTLGLAFLALAAPVLYEIGAPL